MIWQLDIPGQISATQEGEALEPFIPAIAQEFIDSQIAGSRRDKTYEGILPRHQLRRTTMQELSLRDLMEKRRLFQKLSSLSSTNKLLAGKLIVASEAIHKMESKVTELKPGHFLLCAHE